MANALNTVNSDGIEDGSIVNADIKSDAAIAKSKLAALNIGSSDIADNAVGLAQMAGGTDGQIITYDASGDPIAVGPGDDGQVLTSTGAGSPPAFEDIPASTGTASFRRININGACSVSQRGNTTGITNGTAAHLCYGGPDRYKLYVAQHGTYTISQELDAPDGFDQSLKVDTTAADSSLASGARVYIQNKIEKYDVIRTKKGTSGALALTVQFWVKSNKTGTYIFELWDNQNNRHISSTYAISSANTWEKKTMTFAGDTAGNAFVAGNGSGIDCNWWLAAGSSFTSGSLATSWTGNTDANRAVGQTVNIGDSGYWFMTGFQIETGSSATDFEYKSYGDELARCQRYYWQESQWIYAYQYSSAHRRVEIRHPVQMRAIPTETMTSTVGAGGTFAHEGESNQGFQAYISSAYNDGDPDYFTLSKFDAEL